MNDDFNWIRDAWFIGRPDERCRYCGLPVLFAPACLEIRACTCGSAPEMDAPARASARPLAVKFSRAVKFELRVRAIPTAGFLHRSAKNGEAFRLVRTVQPVITTRLGAAGQLEGVS
ncbi:MAG: hypothetical protein HYY24_25690 [Verrucomicrobia bacterium]|nr:hypothetical protein [Verrucomicrobiota bacterium]